MGDKDKEKESATWGYMVLIGMLITFLGLVFAWIDVSRFGNWQLLIIGTGLAWIAISFVGMVVTYIMENV